MSAVAYIFTIVAMVAVVIVLIRGLWNMMKGGDANTSNKLMQMRIALQLVAIVLIVVTIWLARGGS
ncbi:MAG TPA: twin transmembrane helix small protein [Pararhizobium sp.]|nr:twin transmembrane helix small protein [Pararhizobium sp.]